MLKHPFYHYGSTDQQVPVNLNFGEFIMQKLVQYKDRMLVNGLTNESMSFGEIAQQSMSLGVSLTQLEVPKGQTVALCSENRMEFFVAVVGSICTGATFSTINAMFTKDELSHVLDISKPRYIICSPMAYKLHEKTFRSLKYIKYIIVFGDERPPNTISFNDLVGAHNVKFDEVKVADVDGTRDTLFVLYSSGTTGLPKGVMLTHLNALVACADKTSESLVPDRLVQLVAVPWFHAVGLMLGFLSFANGWDMVYLPKFHVDLTLKCIEKYKINCLNSVPPMLEALAKYRSNYDLSSVTGIYCGAGSVSKETIETVKKMFSNAQAVYKGYGMTEGTLSVTRDITGLKLGSVGTVAAGIVVKVVDPETRHTVGPDQLGEICVKGGTVMKGYVGKDRREDFDEEGFFRTGDLGYYDRDGYFFIVDRLKELIKYNAYQVAPAEIEAVLLQHPGVRDAGVVGVPHAGAGVVGVPHAGAGEVPRAFVALQPGASVTAEELQQFVAERLSNPKHLRGGVRFVAEVPKNPSGKILRRQLRAMVESKL